MSEAAHTLADPRTLADPIVTTVITNGHVLTMDSRFTTVPNGAVLVSGQRILAVRPMNDPRVAEAIEDGATVIDAAGGIVLPGMINTHTHMGMTLFRGTADDRDLQGFLAAVWPLEESFVDATTVVLGTTIAIAESLSAGVTTAADMYFHNADAADTAERIGFRLLTGPALLGGVSIQHTSFDEAFAAAREWLVEREPGLALRMSIAPHSTYTLTDKQLRRVAALSAEFDALVQIHAAENAGEMALVAQQHDGATPIEVLQRVGLLEGHIVVAHAVHLSDSDLDLLSARGERTRGLAHCPASNMKLASGVARVPEILGRKLAVGLGTDGPASSNDLDLFAAMRLGGMLHSLSTGPGSVSARDLVAMATIGGARALGLEHWVGSLEMGKFADIVVMDGASPLAVGTDPYSALVYALGRAEVRTVLVDGIVRMQDGQTAGVDIPALTAELAELVASYPSAV